MQELGGSFESEKVEHSRVAGEQHLPQLRRCQSLDVPLDASQTRWAGCPHGGCLSRLHEALGSIPAPETQ